MIQAFDKTGVSLGFPNFIELQWNRRFNGFGDFVVYMPADLYDPDIKYIQNVDRPETGIVQKIVFEQKPEGDFVTLSGNFIEALLNWGMIWKDKAFKATTAAGVRTRIRHIVRDGLTMTSPPTVSGYTDPEMRATNPQLYSFSIDASAVTPATMDLAYPKCSPIGDILLEWFNDNGYSFTASPIWNTSGTGPYLGLAMEPYAGTDRSGTVFFGKPYGNVSSVEYVLDESAERAEYIAVQDINATQASSYTNVIQISTSEGTKRYIQTHTWTSANAPSDMRGAYPLKILYTSAGSDTTDTQANIVNQMKQAARMDMLDNYKLETVSVDVLQNRFVYPTDYDLGDTISIVVSGLNLTFMAQIMEIYEVTSGNQLQVQLVLGTPKRQNWRRR